MKLRIENIGPVKRIDIDLSKPMIIFTGLNGSGKTYVSYVIYTLFRLFSPNEDFLNWNEFVKSQQNEISHVLDVDKLYILLQKHIDLINKIPNLAFGVDFKDDIIKDTRITLLTTKSQFREELISDEQIIDAEGIFVFVKKKGSLEYTLKNMGGSLEYSVAINYIVVKSLLFNSIIEDIEPSDRSGLSTFSNEIISGLENYKTLNDKSSKNSNLDHPLAIKRFLDDLKDNMKPLSERTRHHSLADDIERNLMHGHLMVNESNEIFYQKDGTNVFLPLKLSSSGVKSICSIILFLRNSAMDCNLIIIDEPEINLHPKYQVLIARMLAKAVNAGIRLIINTHSDYIIREINNMIMLSSIKDDKKLKQLGYSKEEILSCEDVSPYYFEFQKQDRYVIGKEVPVSKTGFSINEIDDVINSQVVTSQNIYEAIYG